MSFPESKYVKVEFKEGQERTTTQRVYQFDHGKVLQIYGLSDTMLPQVHFNYDRSQSSAINVTSELVGDHFECPIPNQMMFMPRQVWAWVYIESADSGYTQRIISIPVVPRARPSAYVLTEEQRNGYNEILAAANSFIEAWRNRLAENGVDIISGAANLVNDAKEDVAKLIAETKQELDRVQGQSISKINDMIGGIYDDVEWLKSRFNRDMAAFGCIETVQHSGNFKIQDSSDYDIRDVKLYGYTKVNDQFQFVDVNGDIKLNISDGELTYTVDQPLSGIPVVKPGNYFEGGYHYVCDELDLYTGKATTRITQVRPTEWKQGLNCWYTDIDPGIDYADPLDYLEFGLTDLSELLMGMDESAVGWISGYINDNMELILQNGHDGSNAIDLTYGVLCNQACFTPCYRRQMGPGWCYLTESNRFVIMTDSQTPPQGVVLKAVRLHPVEYEVDPLVAPSYHTDRTVTEIQNDSLCGIQIEYYADIKTYIDNRMCRCDCDDHNDCCNQDHSNEHWHLPLWRCVCAHDVYPNGVIHNGCIHDNDGCHKDFLCHNHGCMHQEDNTCLNGHEINSPWHCNPEPQPRSEKPKPWSFNPDPQHFCIPMYPWVHSHKCYESVIPAIQGSINLSHHHF